MIKRNQAMTMKEKKGALTALLENIQKFGELETSHAENKLKIDEFNIKSEEELEKQDVERRTQSNKFVEEILGKALQSQVQSDRNPQQQEQQQDMAGMGQQSSGQF